MQINTTRFGRVDIRPTDVLEFPFGLIGLEAWRSWVVLADGHNAGLGWLQSTERAELALAVVSPRRFVPDYRVRVSHRDLAALEAPEGVTPQVVVAVSSVPDGPAGESLSLNLKAPILVSIDSRRGRQVVAKDDHPVRRLLGGERVMRRSA
ncbi:MAG: flagellar assembly protein FliW [Planctomycetota bacterium]